MHRVKKTGWLLIASALVAGVGFAAWQATRPASVVVGSSRTDLALTPPTYRLVQTLEDRARRGGEQAMLLTKLGYAYIQSARESGEGDYMDGARRAFSRALDLDPQAFEAMRGLGMVYASDHQFKQALAWGRRALEINPHQAATYGVLVDAHIELGRYEEAIDAAQRMVDLRPDQASYSRISYLRELHGDVDGAIDAMQRAVSAGSGSLENTAWCQVYLGHLYYQRGDLDAATRAYRMALHTLPKYGHALAGLARVALARGAVDEAIASFRAAAAAFPIPEYLIALGEVYEAAGQADSAEAYVERAITLSRHERASGMDVDEELALLLLDHTPDVDQALDLARGAYARRPTVKNASILAWAYYKKGNYSEALSYAVASLRLGTPEAVYFYRAGMIAAAAGHTEQARRYLKEALQRNPYFSVRGAEEARQQLAVLETIHR